MGTTGPHVKQNKLDSDREVRHVSSYMWNLKYKLMKVEGVLLRKRKRTRRSGRGDSWGQWGRTWSKYIMGMSENVIIKPLILNN
jgi:hypothetical protein